MTPLHHVDPVQDRLEEEAVTWVVRLSSGEAAEAELSRWRAWRRQSPAHEQAFQNAWRLWTGMEPLRQRAEPCIGGPGRSWPHARGAWHVARLPAAIAAAVAILVIGVFMHVGSWSSLFADYRTGLGERRTIALSDGTVVHLNTNGALTVRYSGEARRVELLAGEAAFEVAKDATRPFLVLADGGWVRAVGTEFLVRRHTDAVTVTVVEGHVEVTYLAKDPTRPTAVTLHGNQRVSYDQAHGLGRTERFDARTAAAWRRGTLIFESTPLTTVVAEINRYRRGRIFLLNEALASHQVSGVFFLDRLDEATRTIESTLPVQSIHLTNRFIVLR